MIKIGKEVYEVVDTNINNKLFMEANL